MRTSISGVKFISRQEGCPLTCYLDPVGIPTIGHGFTMRSKAVRYELSKIGITKLIPGKTKITQKQADDIFIAVLETEFEPYVNAFIGKVETPHNQAMFDAEVSATWNLGPKFLTWGWTKPLLKGDKNGAASIWAVNYNKAGGKRLPGLVRRREEEAKLFLTGNYSAGKSSAVKAETIKAPKTPDPEVKAAQEALNKVGIPVEKDGWLGPKTTAAIKKYQAMHPHLTVDGILGPATIAQLTKDTAMLKDAAKSVIPVTGVAGAVSTGAGLPVGWIIAGVAVIAIAAAAYFIWKRRDIVQRKVNGLKA